MQIEDGEIVDDDDVKDAGNKDSVMEESVEAAMPSQNEGRDSTWPRRVGDQRPRMMVSIEVVIELVGRVIKIFFKFVLVAFFHRTP